MNQKEHTIARVLPGSIAEELELEAGDVLLSVGGQRVQDIFDYRYLTNDGHSPYSMIPARTASMLASGSSTIPALLEQCFIKAET